MRNAAAESMRSLAADERPDIDGHSATYQAIREMPDGLDPVDVEIRTLLRDRFHTAQDAFWVAEDELTACKGELPDAIGTGKRAVGERPRVATRTVRDGYNYSITPAGPRRNDACPRQRNHSTQPTNPTTGHRHTTSRSNKHGPHPTIPP